VKAVNDAPPSSGLSELQADVWKCLMCHRCTMACPKEIDVAGAIRSLRYDSASSGEPPKRFRKASDTLVTEGRAFPVNDIVHQKRAELGLKKINDSTNAVRELKTIMSRTGFLHE
jgi:heterodisulfide reductase subunit C